MTRGHYEPRQFAVYSIVDREAALAAIKRGGAGVLHEGKRWAAAAKMLEDNPSKGSLPLLLADAGSIQGVEWAGTIERIELLENDGTTVHFKDLSFLRNRVPLRRLLKLSNGEPLSDNYIRPYSPCILTSEVAALVNDRVHEERLGAGAEPFGTWEAAREVDEDPQTKDLPETVRQALVESRLGQGVYRECLLRIWEGRCAVTGCSITEVLIASHAKPWTSSTSRERLDEYNGLLLAASVDKLFDRGLISFQDDGRMLTAEKLSDEDLHSVGLTRSSRLRKVLPGHKPYLRAHRLANGFEGSADVRTPSKSTDRSASADVLRG